MLLRIIDHPATGNGEDAIRIVFEHKQSNTHFMTEYYDSPFSANFREKLAWYFNEYPQIALTQTDSGNVIEKLIKSGQNMGNELLGEDHQLIQITEDIERNGYANLQVQIESARVGFFNELWETAILPESNYVLSTAVKGYLRRFVNADAANHWPELRFDLKVTLPSQDSVNQLLQGGANKNAGDNTQADEQKPLRILTLISRVSANDLPFTQSNGINASMQAFAAGGVIDNDIHQKINWQQLCERLADQTQPVHIFCYDGPIRIEHGEASILLDNGTQAGIPVSIASLAKVLVAHKVPVLAVDARAYLDATQSVCASQGLAMIAQTAQQQGLGNVIGLAQLTNSWTSSQCFEAIYAQITVGLSLEQAVVEARKGLQSNTQTSLLTVKPIPFHIWSLLVHYSQQSITFFSPKQLPSDPNMPAQSAPTRQRLFGFINQMLPPILNQIGDAQVLPLIEHLSGPRQAVTITGEAGTGKTQLAHVACTYLAQKQHIDYGFYFDFASQDYSPADILQMVGSVLPAHTDTSEQLATHHCCFVFDGLLPVTNLTDFIAKLIDDGHKVMMIADAPQDKLTTIEIKTLPLTLIEQRIMAANALRRSELMEVEQDEQFQALLGSLNGHPWLIDKLMPLLASNSASELTTQISQHLHQQGSKVEAFYQWQWATLTPVWQQVLILCSDVPGLLLEMLMVAGDQKPPFAAATSLFDILGEADGQIATGLECWTLAGFVSRFPHGRMVDSRCVDFLQHKREQCFANIPQQSSLALHFSQLICEGVRLLSSNMVKQENSNIVNNLLLNRQQWAKHLEKLWFGEDYRGFISSKNAFDALLQQYKLGQEIKEWSLDLLQRTPLIPIDEAHSVTSLLAWLSLASGVLNQKEAKNSECLRHGANMWQHWFNAITDDVDEQQLPLIQHAGTFLQRFYESQANWSDAIHVCEKLNGIYRQYEAWHWVIQLLKSLAVYHTKMGDKAQALAVEAQILDDISYAGSPPDFKSQQMLDVLQARLARAEIEQAQPLLEQLKHSDKAEKFADILGDMQCEIYYQQQDYLAALPYYCQRWSQMLQANHLPQIALLQSRLAELAQKIGEQAFLTVFQREVPEGTIRPEEYVA
jgi:hypothetical protein